MKNVRLVRKDERAVSPVIATILLVAITVVLAAVLYVMVTVLIVQPDHVVPLTVNIQRQGTNWLVEVVDGPGGLLPGHTYLLIRDANGAIALPQTPWSSLTQDRWGETKALYEDANPGSAEIRAPDGILLDQTAYPAGSRIVVSDDQNLLTTRNL